MNDYCLGFLFNIDRDSVLLIEKQKPPWQKGKLNGVGGLIEDGENAEQAMVREFYEETGVKLPNWECNGILSHPEMGGIVWLFRAFSDELYKCSSQTIETLHIYTLCNLIRLYTTPSLNNLKFLIPLACQEDRLFSTFLYKD